MAWVCIALVFSDDATQLNMLETECHSVCHFTEKCKQSNRKGLHYAARQ